MQSNSELIDAVLADQDRDAFKRLIERYERLVWTVAWRILTDYHATQDVTQETFLIAHTRLAELRDPDSIANWLARIAHNEATRVGRLRRKTQSVEQIDVAVTETWERISDEYQALLTAIAGLPEHERTVTCLRYLNGHTLAEVAELTGRPLGTVSKQLSRAVERLKASHFNKQVVNTVSCHATRLPNVQ